MIELVVRLAFSLAVVLGLLTLLARVSARRFRGATDAPIRVVHRQALSRGSAVAVVSVGSRVLVVGTTEQQVSLLAELDPAELEGPGQGTGLDTDPDDDLDNDLGLAFDDELAAVLAVGSDELAQARAPESPGGVRPGGAHKRSRTEAASRAVRAGTVSQGVLAGSALSAQTWRQAFAVATRREQDAS